MAKNPAAPKFPPIPKSRLAVGSASRNMPLRLACARKKPIFKIVSGSVSSMFPGFAFWVKSRTPVSLAASTKPPFSPRRNRVTVMTTSRSSPDFRTMRQSNGFGISVSSLWSCTPGWRDVINSAASGSPYGEALSISTALSKGSSADE